MGTRLKVTNLVLRKNEYFFPILSLQIVGHTVPSFWSARRWMRNPIKILLALTWFNSYWVSRSHFILQPPSDPDGWLRWLHVHLRRLLLLDPLDHAPHRRTPRSTRLLLHGRVSSWRPGGHVKEERKRFVRQLSSNLEQKKRGKWNKKEGKLKKENIIYTKTRDGEKRRS